MGVFSRFKDIVNANINALLDKAEDPEKMLKLMMQEMEDTLIELKSNCAARMASKIRLERKIAEQKALISRWQTRAELAVDKGRDDLARDALIEKKKETETLNTLLKDVDNYSEIIEQSKTEINQIEDKLNQAKLKLKSLQEKARAAEAEVKVKALAMNLVSSLQELLPLNPMYSDEMRQYLLRFDQNDPSLLADCAASVTTTSAKNLQDILDTVDL